jgi:hypothetical protein
MKDNLETPKRQDNKKEDWIRSHWRPMMAVVYMTIVIFDFIVAPVLWSTIQVLGSGSVSVQWSPLTILSAGIFHVSMGAVLGISALTRGREKVERLRSFGEYDDRIRSFREDDDRIRSRREGDGGNDVIF